MSDTMPSPDYILGLGPEQISNLIDALTRERQLSALVRDLNDVVLAHGVDTRAGEVLRRLGFLV